MKLSNERFGEISLLILAHETKAEGITIADLDPREMREDAMELVEKLGLSVEEALNYVETFCVATFDCVPEGFRDAGACHS